MRPWQSQTIESPFPLIAQRRITVYADHELEAMERLADVLVKRIRRHKMTDEKGRTLPADSGIMPEITDKHTASLPGYGVFLTATLKPLKKTKGNVRQRFYTPTSPFRATVYEPEEAPYKVWIEGTTRADAIAQGFPDFHLVSEKNADPLVWHSPDSSCIVSVPNPPLKWYRATQLQTPYPRKIKGRTLSLQAKTKQDFARQRALLFLQELDPNLDPQWLRVSMPSNYFYTASHIDVPDFVCKFTVQEVSAPMVSLTPQNPEEHP
ncbi:MAG: hypothetical protein AB7U75_14675 [Hyphomicrobiaceae bacterium]